MYNTASMMASTFDDTVFDFDLNFLRQTTNNTVVHSKVDKQRKAILIAKKKAIATDSLIRKYYAKKELLDQTQQMLLTSKEECKQICIDYKNALEKCSKLEMDAQTLQNSKQELEVKCLAAENRCEAIQSHSNQLQLLLKDRETNMEAIKIERQLEKTNVKSFEKKMALLTKEKEDLMKHISIIVVAAYGKKKLSQTNKNILEKYKKMCGINQQDSLSEGENNDDETDIFDNPSMSPSPTDFLDINNEQGNRKIHADKHEMNECSQGKSALKRDDIDRDSDYSHEIVSVDTGRGSSLAFSDSDKCFHSPDYFMNDSPLNDVVISREKKNLIDIATSPIRVNDTNDKGTSPIMFEEYDNSSNLEQIQFKDLTGYKISSNSRILIDKAVSPVKLNLTKDMSTSPIQKSINSTVESSIGNETTPNNESYNSQTNIQECLDLNNSNNLHEDISSDSEIKMILDKMRFTHELITPIPSTPVKSRGSVTRRSDTAILHNNHSRNECQDAAILREDHKVLHTSLADLTKEVMSIKNLLSNQLRDEKDKNSLANHEPLVDDCTSNLEGEFVENTPQRNIINNLQFIDSESRSARVERERENDKNSMVNHGPFVDDNMSMESEFEEIEDNTVNNLQFTDSEPRSIRNEYIIRCQENLDSNPTQRVEFTVSQEDESVISQKDLSISKKLQFEEEIQTKNCVENDIDELHKVVNTSNNIPERHENVTKPKPKKLTKLGKLRNKLLPKSKIQRVKTPPPRRLLVRLTRLETLKRNVMTSATSASLNDKVAYEKAVKVMAELNAKRKVDTDLHELNVNSNKELDPNTNNNTRVNKLRKGKTSETKNDSSNSISYKDSIDRKVRTPSPKLSITTRSRSKCVQGSNKTSVRQTRNSNEVRDENKVDDCSVPKKKEVNLNQIGENENRKRLKRASVDKPDIQSKRILRSSGIHHSSTNNMKDTLVNEELEVTITSSEVEKTTRQDQLSPARRTLSTDHISEDINKVVDYNDIDLFTDESVPSVKQQYEKKGISTAIQNPQESALCTTIEKYAVSYVKNNSRKVSDTAVNSICSKLEEGIAQIIEVPHNEAKQAMNKFVGDIRNWDLQQFLLSLMKYYKNPDRQTELLSKVHSPPAPAMTKSEQILIYIITQLQGVWPNIIGCILNNIEYTLFKLNRTPEFYVIESMSHFYAVICRYIRAKSRLRLFILDAMYCIQFKAVPLIKQCLDVWMHILPLAHMGIAKSPLVTCLVYLLHFFKCEDKFNRLQVIRNILSQKYFYQITEWNETIILELFKNSIKELRDNVIEKKMLRLALIILAKRQGPRWCQNNIIKNMLLPMIEKEQVPERVKVFCVHVTGALLKPYPVEMKVHCEIVMNQLIDILDRNPSRQMQEAIFTSLIYMSKHNQNRVIQTLLCWKPKQISPEMENVLKDYVREKPMKIWKITLSKIPLIR